MGQELEKMSDEELSQQIEGINILQN